MGDIFDLRAPTRWRHHQRRFELGRCLLAPRRPPSRCGQWDRCLDQHHRKRRSLSWERHQLAGEGIEWRATEGDKVVGFIGHVDSPEQGVPVRLEKHVGLVSSLRAAPTHAPTRRWKRRSRAGRGLRCRAIGPRGCMEVHLGFGGHCHRGRRRSPASHPVQHLPFESNLSWR